MGPNSPQNGVYLVITDNYALRQKGLLPGPNPRDQRRQRGRNTYGRDGLHFVFA